jgi:hypothetical protein
MKLSRKEIKEGLEQIPVEKLLLGSAAHGIGLTKKQKAFANEVVKSGNKTKAYKTAYNHTGKPETASRNAQTLANDTKVATYIAALEAAEQARAYLVPARLRDLAIHKITEKALDPDVPPAQQLKALELLGKITEVSLFTHRTETVHLTSSADIKEQLIKSLRLAMSGNNVTDVEAKPVDDLLAELAGRDDPAAAIDSDSSNILQDAAPLDDADQDPVTPSLNPDPADPPSPDPQKSALSIPPQLHSIPHNQSLLESKTLNSTFQSTVTVTGVTLTQGKPLDGEGVIENAKDE